MRIVFLALLLVACGSAPNQGGRNHLPVSDTADVIGPTDDCVAQGATFTGFYELKGLKVAEVVCQGNYFAAVVTTPTPTNRGDKIPKASAVLLTWEPGGWTLLYNGVKVGHRPVYGGYWRTLCTGSYSNVCDLYLNPLRLELK